MLKNAKPSALLSLGFLCERWGIPSVLGKAPDLTTISKMTQLLNIYHIFVKSKNGRDLTATEKMVKSQVMALAIGMTDVYLEQSAYEME